MYPGESLFARNVLGSLCALARRAVFPVRTIHAHALRKKGVHAAISVWPPLLEACDGKGGGRTRYGCTPIFTFSAKALRGSSARSTSHIFYDKQDALILAKEPARGGSFSPQSARIAKWPHGPCLAHCCMPNVLREYKRPLAMCVSAGVVFARNPGKRTGVPPKAPSTLAVSARRN